MFNLFFQEEAAASRNKRQQLDHLLRMAAPHERVILVGIGVVLLALVAWALFGSIDRSITSDGVLIEPGERYEIVTTEPGHLMEFLVVPGDRIAVGEPIARQSAPESEREAAVLRDRVDLLETGIRQAGGDNGALRSTLASAQVALMQMEARRSARELIVSHVEGEVMALRSAPGEYLPAGASVAQIRDMESRPLHAVLRIEPDMAKRVKSGMLASIEVMAPDGTSHWVDGEVTSVTPGPLPRWLAALQPAVADSMYRVDVGFRQASSLSVPDGAPCRVRVVLGRHSFAALFESERP